MRAPDASVVFTLDNRGEQPRAYWGGYAVTKAGVATLARELADEWENRANLRINAVVPGPIRSPLRNQSHPGEDRDALPHAGIAGAALPAPAGRPDQGRKRRAARRSGLAGRHVLHFAAARIAQHHAQPPEVLRPAACPAARGSCATSAQPSGRQTIVVIQAPTYVDCAHVAGNQPAVAHARDEHEVRRQPDFGDGEAAAMQARRRETSPRPTSTTAAIISACSHGSNGSDDDQRNGGRREQANARAGDARRREDDMDGRRHAHAAIALHRSAMRNRPDG